MTSNSINISDARGGLWAYLELMQIGCVFAAMADVLAGCLFAGWGLEHAQGMALLLAAAGGLHCGGCVLGDWFDLSRDSAERPWRPIPSGRVSPGGALLLGIVLLLGGWLIACCVSQMTGLIASAIVVCVLIYGGWAKSTIAGPAFMGACRGLYLFMGLMVVADQLTGMKVFLAWSMMLYIASLTWFASGGNGPGRRVQLLTAGAGMMFAVIFVCLLYLFGDMEHWWYLALGLVMIGLIGGKVNVAAASLSPDTIQGALKTFVLLAVIFDAMIVFAARGPYTSAIVAALVVPAALSDGLLRRRTGSCRSQAASS